jgi:broad specificity phosphatase PhoE
MNDQTTIYFVRHGEVHNPRNVFYGRLPRFRLSKRGQIQAQTTTNILGNKPLTAIFSSPLLRARQTAKIIFTPHDIQPMRISQLLNEVHTPFDGHPVKELIARDWDIYRDVPGGYEQPPDILERAKRFIANIRTKYPGQHVVAVTHGDVILFLVLWAKGIPVSAENKREFERLGFADDYPAPVSITTLAFQTSKSDQLPSVEYTPSNLEKNASP